MLWRCLMGGVGLRGEGAWRIVSACVWWLAAWGGSHEVSGDDWPTYRHDQRRSGVTSEVIEAARLRPVWRWRSALPPSPAWPDAAKWDAYAKLDGLRSMRDYDSVLHPIVVGDRLFLPGNADDTVRCLGVDDGQERWRLTVDAPVRIAPTHHNGVLYFGCDDGAVYACDAETGKIRWRTPLPGANGTPGESFLNDGRICAMMPVRSGVLVDAEAGTGVVAACMFPWQTTLLVGLDLESGETVWRRDLGTGWTLEGAMLLSPSYIIAPQGRSPPLRFERDGGRPAGAMSGGGGSFVLLTEDARLFHGPGNKGGWITESDAAGLIGEEGAVDKIASFDKGLAIVVRGPTAFLLDDRRLAAFDRRAGEFLWVAPCDCPHELVLAGDTLFAGGDGQVVAYSSEDGTPVWRGEVEGRAIGLAVAAGGLFVSTDVGVVHRFVPQGAPLAPPTVREPASDVEPAKGPGSEILPESDPVVAPATGPVLKFLGKGTAEIRWTTSTPQPTRLLVSEGEAEVVIAEPETETLEHIAILTRLEPQAVAKFRIGNVVEGRSVTSDDYECDTHFDYTRPPLPRPGSGVTAESPRAERWLSGIGERDPRGIGVVWGCGDEGRFAECLARLSGHDVIVIDEDRGRIEATRRRLVDAGVYGRVVSARVAGTAEESGIPPGAANWLWIDPRAAETLKQARHFESVLELVQPRGFVGVPDSWGHDTLLTRAAFEPVLDEDGEPTRVPVAEESISLRLARAPRLDGAAGWTHMYGTADNAAYAGETLSGVRHTDDLRVAWAGRPGPRYQSDRGNRKPSPLASDGRLYLQGLHRTIGIDAHNGSILWSLELPEVVRFNVPRDCSNWCADRRNVFIAARHRCLVIDGRSGTITREWPVPAMEDAATGEQAWQWGYVARPANLLVGSAVRAGASFTEFWGAESWYDSADGEHAKKVCSDFLFGLDPESGEPRWRYRGGLVVNPTITIADGRLHFVECRSSKAIADETRRLDGDDFWDELFLVTLDLASGERLWETPAKPMEGQSAFYLVAAEGRLLMQSSKSGMFAVYSFDAKTGEMLWRGRYDWEADHHGKHLSRPAVVEGKIYLRPLTLDLADGSVVSESFPDGHQCGTYTASRDALFLRAGNLTVWDRVSDGATRWDRLRPDCWISTIPAEGMLLSPEGGGGCSCGGWIETSIGFTPRWRIR